VIRRKRRYSSPHATWRRHGRASWWSRCLRIVWLVTSHLCLFFIREIKAIPVSLQACGSIPCRPNPAVTLLVITSDKGAGICVCPRLSVCLSVCLLTRLLKNACMDLDEIFHVDRCRDTDELINFWARSGWQSGSRSRIYTGFLNFSGIFVKVINGFRWNFMGR